MQLRTGLFLFILACSFQNEAAASTLRLFIWEAYFPDEVLTEFEKQTGIKVEQVYYETDELKDETLISTQGGEGLDLIVGSRVSFKEYVKYGWLSSYTELAIKNLNNIEERWLPQGALRGYSLPYLWGTVGIAYRKDKVTVPIDSWQQLFKPDTNLKQRIMMINDSRDTIGLALKALGYSINSSSTQMLKQAETLLLAQKPYVKKYSYPTLDEKSALVTGDIWMSMIYNGDAITLQDYNNQISFVVPKEGTNLWIDDIGVLKKSGNPVAAWQFIDFINQPQIAAKISAFTFYASPNKNAKAYLKPAFLADSRIFPNQEIIEKSEFFKDLSAKQLKSRGDIFLKVAN